MNPRTTPYINHTGDIVIPSDTDKKYHFWNGGQDLTETLLELNVSEDVWKRYSEKPYPGNGV